MLALEEGLKVVPDQLNDRGIEHDRSRRSSFEASMIAAPYTDPFGWLPINASSRMSTEVVEARLTISHLFQFGNEPCLKRRIVR